MEFRPSVRATFPMLARLQSFRVFLYCDVRIGWVSCVLHTTASKMESTHHVRWSYMSDLSVNFEPQPSGSDNPDKRDSDPMNRGPQSSNVAVVDPNDFAFMQRLAAGDEEAMTRLIERHGQMLARLVGRLMAWSPDHEDVFQDVLLVIWQKANNYRGTGSLEGWLRTLAANRCYNHLRRQNSFRQLLANFFDSQRSKFKPEKPSESAAIENALKELTAKERTVIVLYYLEEMSGEEVAVALGIRTESLHVRLHRARQKLKSLLSAKGEL